MAESSGFHFKSLTSHVCSVYVNYNNTRNNHISFNAMGFPRHIFFLNVILVITIQSSFEHTRYLHRLVYFCQLNEVNLCVIKNWIFFNTVKFQFLSNSFIGSLFYIEKRSLEILNNSSKVHKKSGFRKMVWMLECALCTGGYLALVMTNQTLWIVFSCIMASILLSRCQNLKLLNE